MHDLGRDAARDARLAKHGYDVLRFGVQEVDTNLQGVVSTICDAVQLRLLRRTVGEKDQAPVEE
jgi:very-short-patch-repair endonuclease